MIKTKNISSLRLIMMVHKFNYLCKIPSCYLIIYLHLQNEIMTFAVYDLPWYLFEKKDRELVHTFLCEVQGTYFQIMALKLFRVSMNAFIRILQFNYSIINLLRRLEIE